MKLFPHPHSARRALTALDVFLVIATLALLAIAALPMLARSKARSSKIRCTSNLKFIGLSYGLWANDHGDQFPFALSTNSGGTLELVNSPQSFQHFVALSNELTTLKKIGRAHV